MDLREWSKSNADYGRRLLDSGIAGALSGREEFLNGESIAPFLNESVRGAATERSFAALNMGAPAFGLDRAYRGMPHR